MESLDSANPPVRVPFTTVLASIVGLWLCYFLLTTVRAEIMDFGLQNELLWRRAVVCMGGVVITLGLWLVLRLFDQRPLWAKIVAALLVSLPVSVALAQANQMAFSDVERTIRDNMQGQEEDVSQDQGGDLLGGEPRGAPSSPEMTPLQQITEVAMGRYFMMLAWSALYLALLTGEKARIAERREGDFRRAAKAAELRSLRYQVNPHFLFNTLNSLSALVLTGKVAAAERMIQMLSTFYRRSLADDPTSDVPLSEEFALQRLYLDLEAVRFPERLEAKYDLPPQLQDYLIPGLILQPLVENSVKHAVAPTSGKVTITLSAREEYGRLVVTVEDNGKSGPKRGEPRPGFGIGLSNVNERLEARFGNEASVVSGATESGYATHIRLPVISNRKQAA